MGGRSEALVCENRLGGQLALFPLLLALRDYNARAMIG